MWYFTWVLGVGFAVFLVILNALWMENAEARKSALSKTDQSNRNSTNRESTI